MSVQIVFSSFWLNSTSCICFICTLCHILSSSLFDLGSRGLCTLRDQLEACVQVACNHVPCSNWSNLSFTHQQEQRQTSNLWTNIWDECWFTSGKPGCFNDTAQRCYFYHSLCLIPYVVLSYSSVSQYVFLSVRTKTSVYAGGNRLLVCVRALFSVEWRMNSNMNCVCCCWG